MKGWVDWDIKTGHKGFDKTEQNFWQIYQTL